MIDELEQPVETPVTQPDALEPEKFEQLSQANDSMWALL